MFRITRLGKFCCTLPTLVHCFQRSQAKVHSPPIVHHNDLEAVEEEIYEWIRAHPGFQQASLSEFIDSSDGAVENSAEEEEQRILDTYEPAALHEWDSEADDISDVPIIPIQQRLTSLRAYVSFVFKTLTLIE